MKMSPSFAERSADCERLKAESQAAHDREVRRLRDLITRAEADREEAVRQHILAMADYRDELDAKLVSDVATALDALIPGFGRSPRDTAEAFGGAWRTLNSRCQHELGHDLSESLLVAAFVRARGADMVNRARPEDLFRHPILGSRNHLSAAHDACRLAKESAWASEIEQSLRAVEAGVDAVLRQSPHRGQTEAFNARVSSANTQIGELRGELAALGDSPNDKRLRADRLQGLQSARGIPHEYHQGKGSEVPDGVRYGTWKPASEMDGGGTLPVVPPGYYSR